MIPLMSTLKIIIKSKIITQFHSKQMG